MFPRSGNLSVASFALVFLQQAEAKKPALDFSVFGFLVVMFWARGHKPDDVNPSLQFADEFAEIIAYRWNGLTGLMPTSLMRENDGVNVEVQHLFKPCGGGGGVDRLSRCRYCLSRAQ